MLRSSDEDPFANNHQQEDGLLGEVLNIMARECVDLDSFSLFFECSRFARALSNDNDSHGLDSTFDLNTQPPPLELPSFSSVLGANQNFAEPSPADAFTQVCKTCFLDSIRNN